MTRHGNGRQAELGRNSFGGVGRTLWVVAVSLWGAVAWGQELRSEVSSGVRQGQSIAPTEGGTTNEYADNRPFSVRAWRRYVNVNFGDGSVVDVLLRGRPPLLGISPDEIATQHESIHGAIEQGNMDAAFSLYMTLDYCKDAYTNERDLHAAVEHLRRTGRLKTPKLSEERAISHEDLSEAERSFLLEPFESCQGVTEAQRADAEHWLRVATNGGVARALRVSAERVEPSQEAILAWEQVWRSGDIGALDRLAKLHNRLPIVKVEYGVATIATVTPWKGPGRGSPDKVLSYAYRLLHTELQIAVARVTGHAMRSDWAEQGEAALLEAAADLTREDIAAAVELAKNILADNTSCCFIGG